jgi:hypothetical protein
MLSGFRKRASAAIPMLQPDVPHSPATNLWLGSSSLLRCSGGMQRTRPCWVVITKVPSVSSTISRGRDFKFETIVSTTPSLEMRFTERFLLSQITMHPSAVIAIPMLQQNMLAAIRTINVQCCVRSIKLRLETKSVDISSKPALVTSKSRCEEHSIFYLINAVLCFTGNKNVTCGIAGDSTRSIYKVLGFNRLQNIIHYKLVLKECKDVGLLLGTIKPLPKPASPG